MVLETSAAVAILLREPGYEPLQNRLLATGDPVMSAVSYMEASMVLVIKRGVGMEKELDRFLYEAGVAIVPVSVAQAKIAREAFMEFGKGRHPARLNFGDCFSYALAKQRHQPLLFKGDDFPLTDVLRAG